MYFAATIYYVKFNFSLSSKLIFLLLPISIEYGATAGQWGKGERERERKRDHEKKNWWKELNWTNWSWSWIEERCGGVIFSNWNCWWAISIVSASYSEIWDGISRLLWVLTSHWNPEYCKGPNEHQICVFLTQSRTWKNCRWEERFTFMSCLRLPHPCHIITSVQFWP